MTVTEVRVTLRHDPAHPDVLAFCQFVIDGAFVVREVKLIRPARGTRCPEGNGNPTWEPLVCMPCRKLTARCPGCGGKNQLLAKFCNWCGAGLPRQDGAGRRPHSQVHADVAHPAHQGARALIHAAVLAAYRAELRKAARPAPVSQEV